MASIDKVALGLAKKVESQVEAHTAQLADTTTHKIERINIVEKFGADKTGVIDCTSDIQSVLSEGKIPYLPKGTYLHNGLTLSMPIIGDGAILKYTGSGVGVTFSNPVVRTEGIIFTSTGVDQALVKITAATEVNFHNTDFVNGGGHGIFIDGVQHSLSFSGRCSIKNNKLHGVFATDIKRSSFVACFISGNGGYGVHLDGYSHGPVFALNQIWGNLQGGIYLQGEKAGDAKLKYNPTVTSSQHPIFIGNHIDHNQDDADTLKPSYGIFIDGVERPTFIGNLVRTSRTGGIHIENGSFGTMIGNEIWKIESGKAINLAAGASRFTLIGNVYSGTDVLVMANPTDHTVLGVDGANNFVYGGLNVLDKLSFKGVGGFIKQYASGGGVGNLEIDLAQTIAKTLTLKNGSSDLIVDVQGKTIKLKDNSGVSHTLTITDSGRLIVDGTTKTYKNTTAARPTNLSNSSADYGVLYLDTSLAPNGKPIWWVGTGWVDATGTFV